MLPHFPSRPRGNGPHSSLLAELEKTENRAQRNNRTKYSPAVAMATGPGASPTSATLFRFALDPEKRRFGFLSVKLSGAGEIGREWSERGGKIERTARWN